MNKISIIIPVYNDYDILFDKLLPSIEKQTIGLKNLEVIVVDDGSDGSTETIRKVQQVPTEWIKYYFQDHKGGNFARNFGTQHATGKYLIYPDADCELFSNCLEIMYDYLERNYNVHFVYCHFLQVDPKGWIQQFTSFKFNKKLLEQQNYISVCTLFRKECFIGWEEKIERFQDWEMWIRMTRKGYIGHLIDEPLFFHFLRKKAISQSVSTYELARLKMFEILDGKRKYEAEDVSGPYGSLKVIKKITPEELKKITKKGGVK